MFKEVPIRTFFLLIQFRLLDFRILKLAHSAQIFENRTELVAKPYN